VEAKQSGLGDGLEALGFWPQSLDGWGHIY
jgi:hypothetical protein